MPSTWVLVLAIAVAAATQTAPVAPTVSVCGSVRSPEGQPVPGLTHLDFSVLEDGAPRPPTAVSFAPPVAVVLLVDVSASMPYSNGLAIAIRDAGQTLRPVDRIAIGTFGRTIAIGPMAAPDPVALLAAGRAAWQRREESTGPSPLWDAVNAALTVLVPENTRRALIVITDGQGTGNLTRYDLVEQRALSMGTAISMVLPGSAPLGLTSRPEAGLRYPWERPIRIARATGGATVTASEAPYEWIPTESAKTLIATVSSLKDEYCVTFAPAALDGRLHDLIVHSRRIGLRTRFPEAFAASK